MKTIIALALAGNINAFSPDLPEDALINHIEPEQAIESIKVSQYYGYHQQQQYDMELRQQALDQYVIEQRQQALERRLDCMAQGGDPAWCW